MSTRSRSLSLALLLVVLTPGAAVTAQTDAPPVAVAESRATAAPSDSPEPGAPAGSPPPQQAFTLEAPRWQRLASAAGPAAREDHTWTVDADGRFAYLFGGRDGTKTFGDLWRFDLATDRWQRLSPQGRRPGARFGHSAAWVEGVGLVVFAGQRDADFFGDLWTFEVISERWSKLPANGAAPKARYGSCMVVGSDGRVWISHGFTFAGRFDDTRAYNLRTRRWASVAPDGRRPGQRCLHDCFTSATGQLVLYGGQDNAEPALGDLWVMRPNGSWKRETDPKARPRRLYAVAEAGADAYVFGGADRAGQPLGDLWRVDRASLAFERLNVPGDGPAARSAATLITDQARGRLLLFGGKAQSARADVWQLVDTAVLAPLNVPVPTEAATGSLGTVATRTSDDPGTVTTQGDA